MRRRRWTTSCCAPTSMPRRHAAPGVQGRAVAQARHTKAVRHEELKELQPCTNCCAPCNPLTGGPLWSVAGRRGGGVRSGAPPPPHQRPGAGKHVHAVRRSGWLGGGGGRLQKGGAQGREEKCRRGCAGRQAGSQAAQRGPQSMLILSVRLRLLYSQNRGCGAQNHAPPQPLCRARQVRPRALAVGACDSGRHVELKQFLGRRAVVRACRSPPRSVPTPAHCLPGSLERLPTELRLSSCLSHPPAGPSTSWFATTGTPAPACSSSRTCQSCSCPRCRRVRGLPGRVQLGDARWPAGQRWQGRHARRAVVASLVDQPFNC